MKAVPDNFPACLEKLLQFEGGFVDNKTDPGGATNFGITQFTYDAFRRRTAQPLQSVRAISKAEISAIYRQSFWTPMQCDQFAFPMAFMLFDTAVQWGCHGAIDLLGKCALVPRKDVPALDQAKALNPSLLAGQLYAARCAFRLDRVAAKPSQVIFFLGWKNRDRNALSFALSQPKPSGSVQKR
jgi:YD repeat-containing protein